VPERRDLLLLEGGAGGDRTMESAVQHGAAAFVAGLQATGAEGNPAQARGAWRCGKRSAFPTSPHPRRRLRTNFKRGATLTIYLVQKIGQVINVDHTTVWRWVQYYGPELEQRLRRYLKPTNKSWRVDETYVRVKGRWCSGPGIFALPAPGFDVVDIEEALFCVHPAKH